MTYWKTPKESISATEKELSSHLNSENLIAAGNPRAVPVVLYGTGTIKWSEEELKEMTSNSGTLLMLLRDLRLCAGTDHLETKGANEGGVLKTMEDWVCIKFESLMKDLAQNKETFLINFRNEGVLRAEENGK